MASFIIHTIIGERFLNELEKTYNIELSEYDSENMIIVECPICHERIALKKNRLTSTDGSTGYWCKKCHKPYYYNLIVHNVEDYDEKINKLLNGKLKIDDQNMIKMFRLFQKKYAMNY